MNYWDEFYKSGKIEDYLKYAGHKKEVIADDYSERSDYKGRG